MRQCVWKGLENLIPRNGMTYACISMTWKILSTPPASNTWWTWSAWPQDDPQWKRSAWRKPSKQTIPLNMFWICYVLDACLLCSNFCPSEMYIGDAMLICVLELIDRCLWQCVYDSVCVCMCEKRSKNLTPRNAIAYVCNSMTWKAFSIAAASKTRSERLAAMWPIFSFWFLFLKNIHFVT